MDLKTKELIAIGAAITANCQPCLAYHADKARESGATDCEIKDAIAVGKTVRRGAAGKLDTFALTITGEAATEEADADGGCSFTSEPEPEKAEAKEGCGCS